MTVALQRDAGEAVDDLFRLQVIGFGHVAQAGEVHVSDTGVLAHCGRPSVYNRATGLDLSDVERTLDVISSFFDGLPHALWLRGEAITHDQDAAITSRGYRPMKPVSGMARSLPAEDLPVREGHRTALLTDPADAAEFAHTATRGYGFANDDRAVVQDLARAVLEHARPFDHGAAYAVRNGIVSFRSVGLLTCTHDLAGLSTIATRPNSRGAGLATAIITRAMNDASWLGYRAAGVVTNPDSARLFEELDFEQVSTYRVYRSGQR